VRYYCVVNSWYVHLLIYQYTLDNDVLSIQLLICMCTLDVTCAADFLVSYR